jgi:nucleoid DNA-binding protein
MADQKVTDPGVKVKKEPGANAAKPQHNAKTRYFERLTAEAGVAPGVVQTILEHIRKMALDNLRSKQIFLLRGIATFRHQLTNSRPARQQQLHGRIFTSKAIPERRKVYCRIIKELERAAVDPTKSTSVVAPVAPDSRTRGRRKKGETPKKPPAMTSSEKFRQAVVASVSQSDITPDVVGKVITGLRASIVRDLREKGSFVLDGLTGFYRVDTPARPMQYSNLGGQNQKLCRGSGPMKRAFCRVPWNCN